MCTHIGTNNLGVKLVNIQYHIHHVCCYVHVCFVQVKTCGAPDALTCLGACTFLLLSHRLGSKNKYQYESACTEVRQRVGSAKQVSKLSLGQNKHGQNITTPYVFLCYLVSAYGRVYQAINYPGVQSCFICLPTLCMHLVSSCTKV